MKPKQQGLGLSWERPVMTQCVSFICVCVAPLLYKVEFWFKDFVALPHWAISGVVYVVMPFLGTSLNFKQDTKELF